MLLTKLLFSLNQFKPQYNMNNLKDREIYSYQMLNGNNPFYEGVLYVGKLSMAQLMAGFPEDAPMLCVQDVEPVKELPHNTFVMDADISLDEVGKEINNCFFEDNRLQNGIKDLVMAHNTNKGLQHMVDEASRILDNPVIVVDVSFKILAMCQSGFSNRPDIEVQRSLGYMLADNVSDMRSDYIYEKLRETRYPHYSQQERHGTAWVNTLVFMHGMEVAQIGVMEQNHNVYKSDFDLINFFSSLVALELEKNDFFKANKGLMHSFFLSELLDGNISDPSLVELRLQHLNWRPTKHMYIMVLMDKRPGFFDGKAKIIPQHIHDILPGSRWAIYDQSIVFLLNMPDDNTSFLSDDNLLYDYLELNNLSATISSRFDNLLYAQKYYFQALRANELGSKLNSESRIYFYPNYICHHIAMILSERYDLTDFFHPAVTEMLIYDKDHNTELLPTLEQHLLHTDNPTLVAAKLFIHRNTVFYRISKIKELFNINLTDGDERMKIQLSLKFLEWLRAQNKI